jgi:hypothetical protein
MARKKYTVEQIISHLREAEVRLGQGATVGAVCRSFGISEQSYYRWRKEYGGLKMNQAKRLKGQEVESTRLRLILCLYSSASSSHFPPCCRIAEFPTCSESKGHTGTQLELVRVVGLAYDPTPKTPEGAAPNSSRI